MHRTKSNGRPQQGLWCAAVQHLSCTADPLHGVTHAFMLTHAFAHQATRSFTFQRRSCGAPRRRLTRARQLESTACLTCCSAALQVGRRRSCRRATPVELPRAPCSRRARSASATPTRMTAPLLCVAPSLWAAGGLSRRSACASIRDEDLARIQSDLQVACLHPGTRVLRRR